MKKSRSNLSIDALESFQNLHLLTKRNDDRPRRVLKTARAKDEMPASFTESPSSIHVDELRPMNSLEQRMHCGLYEGFITLIFPSPRSTFTVTDHRCNLETDTMTQRLIDPPRATTSQLPETIRPNARRSPFPRDLEKARSAVTETANIAVPATTETRSEAHRIPVLDAWRGAALVLLYIGHFFPIYRWDCGALGVEAFFVLSGFLMGRILFVRQTPLTLFYQRRISRIVPAAYVFLLATLGWKLLATSESAPSVLSISSGFLFFVNYVVAGNPSHDFGLPIGHFWSLCVEEHCYIYLSVLCLVSRKLGIRPLWLIIASILVCFGAALNVGGETNWNMYEVYWRSECRASSILLGAAAACLTAADVGSRNRYFGVPTVGWGILAVCWAMYFRLNTMPEFTKYTAGTALLAAGLMLIIQHAKHKLWSFPPLTWIGTISFSLYLWQQPFYVAVYKGQISAGYAVVASIIAAIISYHLIEKPARQWINRRWA